MFPRARRGHENVARLDVAMDEPLRVRGGERGRELLHEPRRARGLKRPFGREQRLEVRAVDEPHREVELAARLAGLVDRYDVGVLDAREAARLAHEALARDGIVRALWRDHLDRRDAIERRLPSAIHDAHAAAAELRLELEVAEHAEHRGHGGSLPASLALVVGAPSLNFRPCATAAKIRRSALAISGDRPMCLLAAGRSVATVN